MNQNPDTMTMKEHAIEWWREQGHEIPDLDSPEWERMYAKWVDFAFQNMADRDHNN